jgi:hypothetical protein
MRVYLITANSDQGPVKLRLAARNKAMALEIFLKAELAPESTITSIKQVKKQKTRT